MRKIEIIPAILPRDYAEISEKAEMVHGLVKTVQIDICDGHFVHSFTWPYKKQDETFEKMLHEEEGLPFWKDIDYEFDLMVDHPENIVDQWVQIGAARIVLHAEVKGDVAGAIAKLAGKVDIGLALNIETPITAIEQFYNSTTEQSDDAGIQYVQLMGIDKVGYQGQSFNEKVIEKVKEVRATYPDLIISIDGGVSLDTAPKLVAAGASRLIVGSAIFESENIVETVTNLKRL